MIRILVAVVALSCATAYGQTIYKGVDEKGNVIYSSTPFKGGKKVELAPISTVPATPSSAAPSREGGGEQSDADRQKRRQALEGKLAEAQRQLDKARQDLNEGESSPETFRTKSGGIGRNVAAYEDKIKKLQEEVGRRAAVVESLKQELANLQ